MLIKSPFGKDLVWVGVGFSEFARNKVEITLEEIEKVPSKDGLVETFKRFHPLGYSKEWTLETQLDFIHSPMGRYFGHLVEYGVLPLWKMTRLDLSWMDLRMKDLKGCDLSGSLLPKDLRGVNFRLCRLHGVEAPGSDFSGANLSGAVLTSCDLRGSVWIESVLWGTEITDCKLQGSYWRESTLRHSRFDDSIFTDSTKIENDSLDCLNF